MLENRMVEDDYIETNNDYDKYLEHLLEKDDEYYEEDYIDDYNDTYFRSWASGVASSGTFYYNGSQTAQDFWLNGWTTKKF